MTHWLDEPRYRHELLLVVPAFWPMLGLSVLVHLAALFFWFPRTNLFAPWDVAKDLAAERLQVLLAAAVPPQPASAASPPPARSPHVSAARRPARPAPERSSPVMVQTEPAAPVSVAPAAPEPAVAPAPPAAAAEAPAPRAAYETGGDLWAYVQARRRERGELDDSPSGSDARHDVVIASNLPAPATGSATQDHRQGGGIFQIKRMDYDDAAFAFYGWNPDMQREAPRLIEVRLGSNSNMQIAVVRQMIAIIREHANGDFVWRSIKHDRSYTLSARPADSAGLEDFLMREFFDDPR